MRGTSTALAVLLLAGAASTCMRAAHAPAPYSLQRALTMRDLCRVSYCRNLSQVAAWSCKLCTQQQMVTNVTVITNASVGMQLFIAHQREVGGQGAVVAAFRGTEVTKNYLQDLLLPTVPYLSDELCSGCRAHEGFHATWAGVATPTLDVIREKLAAYPGAALRLTGHSLGASLALFCAMELHLLHGVSADSVLTFGLPRTGNKAFSKAVSRAPFNELYRLTHWKDPVPHYPPTELFDYRHTATEIFYDAHFAALRQCDGGGEDPECSAQFGIPECLLNVDEHLNYLNATFGIDTCDF